MLHRFDHSEFYTVEIPSVSYGGICPKSKRYLYLLPDKKSVHAAKSLMKYLITQRGLHQTFRVDWLYEPANGKMFGVLVCRTTKNEIGFLRAFSGDWEKRQCPEGWVPSSGFTKEYAAEQKITEKKIEELSSQIKELKSLPESVSLLKEISKKRLTRGNLSRELTNKIHDAYRFENTLGEVLPLRKIFGEASLPPTGMGDCCAPKLLQYAIRHNLEPLSMIEFWWGASSKVNPRIQGHFYSACEPKCYPMLGFLLRGIKAAKSRL